MADSKWRTVTVWSALMAGWAVGLWAIFMLIHCEDTKPTATRRAALYLVHDWKDDVPCR